MEWRPLLNTTQQLEAMGHVHIEEHDEFKVF